MTKTTIKYLQKLQKLIHYLAIAILIVELIIIVLLYDEAQILSQITETHFFKTVLALYFVLIDILPYIAIPAFVIMLILISLERKIKWQYLVTMSILIIDYSLPYVGEHL